MNYQVEAEVTTKNQAGVTRQAVVSTWVKADSEDEALHLAPQAILKEERRGTGPHSAKITGQPRVTQTAP